MDYFLSINKAYGKKRKRKNERDQAKVWILVWIHDFGMEL